MPTGNFAKRALNYRKGKISVPEHRIHALEESLVTQIAAGEVVERPASIVKELLENSLDAASQHISLEIVGSGKEMIRVSDDGCGISSADLSLAVQRHTTSKISSFQDLQKLFTFGFRGEALPSIAAVSHMELTSRSQEESQGSSLTIQGGKISSQKELGRSPGTTVEVRNLFFNTPARLKFLKSEGTERNRILQSFEEVLIAHSSIFFSFKGSNKKVDYPARTHPLDRVQDVWGEPFTEENLVPLAFEHPFLSIHGWISKPQFHQATKSYQLIFINKRPILSRSLTHALYESYRDCLPVGRHPAAILFLEVDPVYVDFNVHPSKREVRFQNESQIYESIIREIRSKRSTESSAPPLFSNPPNSLSTPSVSEYPKRWEGSSPFSKSTFSQSNPILEPIRSNSNDLAQPETLVRSPTRVLSQFHSLYILAEKNEDLLIVDQHAAAERILYEQFRSQLLSVTGIPTQKLLIPFLWNLSLNQAELLKQNLPLFSKLGFQIEAFGETTLRVLEVPALVPEIELKTLLDEILLSLENKNKASLVLEEKIMHAACRAAIKAKDPLTHQELNQLLENLSHCQNPHTCPHGRPTTLTITRQELDKKFGRI